MEIKIILTSYFLTYMYGDRAYEDPLLLSREIIKKAYNDGLYYISSKKNIEGILKEKNKRTLYVFAGIPTFQDVCMNLYPSEKLYALKIKLPYEVLARFEYDVQEKVMIGQNISLTDTQKITLGLNYENEALSYKETKDEEILEPIPTEITKLFQKEIENYRYAILTSVEYLKNSLIKFLESERSKKLLEDEKNLELIKKCYEELICLKE